jgi:hypothetical protein
MANQEEFLERLQPGRLPLYGMLRWDGETEEVITSVNFELDHKESVVAVCARARGYFTQLTSAEWLALDIEVTTRSGKPVRATLKPRHDSPVKVGTARLRQLEQILPVSLRTKNP